MALTNKIQEIEMELRFVEDPTMTRILNTLIAALKEADEEIKALKAQVPSKS